MKLCYFKFSVITFISFLVIVTPAFSQIAPYQAKIIDDLQTGKVVITIMANTSDELTHKIYSTIRPQKNPQPEINILLGTISLSKLQESLRKKGVLEEYFEFDKTANIWTGKDPWKKTNVSSVRSLNKIYGVLFSKNGYDEMVPTPFKVIKVNDKNPLLRFENLSVSLADSTKVYYMVEVGNSGIKLDWFQQYLKKDSRLIMMSAQTFIECKKRLQSINGMADQRALECPNFLIKLSRQ